MHRREFFRYTGLTAAGLAAANWKLPVFSATSVKQSHYDEAYADRKCRVGLIGAGWYGQVDLLRLIQVAPVNVVSICDVDSEHLDSVAKIVSERQISKKEPRKYNDYRKMLAEKDLDLVLIGTPDHWHSLPMIEAVNSGVDVYVQKPIGLDVLECQAMLQAARKTKRVVQVGLQRRSTPHLMEAKRKVIDSGMIGKVGQVEIFSHYGGKGQFFQEAKNPPACLDYEFWTGPAPKLPFREMFRRGGWRNFNEFSNGTLGDMGVHMFDMTRWFLNLGWPKRISSAGGIYLKKQSTSNITDTQTVIFEYDDLQVIWNHRVWSGFFDDKYPWGGFFYGDNGLLKASVFGYDYNEYQSKKIALSGSVTYEYDRYPEDQTEKRLERHCAQAIRNHMTNLLDRMIDRGRPAADIEEGAISTICCILGNISQKLRRPLEWDPVAGKVKNDDEANALLARIWRPAWKHPQI